MVESADRKLTIVRFCLVYTTITYVVFNAANFGKLLDWFFYRGGVDYLGLLSFLAVGLCLYMAVFTLMAHPKTVKPVAIVMTVLSLASAYFISKYGIAIDRSMVMNIVYTNPTEARGFLSLQMIPYLLLATIPIALIVKAPIQFVGTPKYLLDSAKLFTVSIAISIGLLYLQFDSISRAINSSNKYAVQTLIPINYIQSLGSMAQVSAETFYRQHIRKIEFNGQVTVPKDLVVVLAVGETSRQQNFGLYGYKRNDTNPLLSKVEGLHTLNGIARVGSTLYALPEIMTKNGVPLPFATNKAGINTACYVNYTMYDSCEGVGEISVKDCSREGCFDQDVVPLLKENLKSYTSGSRFVVLHLGGGSHGPSYHLRHPKDFRKFKPMCMDADVVSKCTPDELYNSYDNTILYVDFVVTQIIEELEKSKAPYVLIYLSDHGESLLEEGRVFHGMPLGVQLPFEQAHIPLLVKASVPISISQRGEYSQRDIFDTVMHLFSIEGDITDKNSAFIEVAK